MMARTLVLVCALAAIAGPVQAADDIRAGSVFSTAQTASQSFLRFHNTSTVAGTATVTLRDYISGQTLATWTSPSIAPLSEQQFPIGTVESQASSGFTKPAYYSVAVDAGFAGTFQHVLWRPADGTLTNLSTCDTGVTASRTTVAGVHTSTLGTGYPSSVAVTNLGTAAARATLGIYDARNGARLGSYNSALIPVGGQVIVAVSTIESAAGVTPTSAMFHYVIRSEGTAFTGFLQHLVNNALVGVTTDMTTVCALTPAVSAVPSQPARASAIYSTAQTTSQSFLRFHNTGTSAGTVTVALRDYASGTQLATWTSPSIAAGAEQQFAIGTVEGAGSFTKPSYYAVSMDSGFKGYFQHVLWRPADGTLTNLSTCDAGVKSDIAAVSGVHSSVLGAGYPSSIVVNNSGSAATTVRLGVYDARNGARRGTYTTPLIPPNGQQVLTVAAIEAGAGVTPASDMFHYVIKADGVFAGFLQHLVNNTKVGVITDMTTVCALEQKRTGTVLTYVPLSTVKVEQLIGDCDREVEARTGACQATPSRTGARFNVGGTDLGATYEDRGRLVMLFGDTISSNPSAVNYGAGDPIAVSTSTDPDGPLVIDFLTRSDGSPQFIRPTGVNMGAFNVPNAGISLSDGVYMVLNIGAASITSVSDNSNTDVHENASSILVRFDETQRTFTRLRTISQLPTRRFLFTALRQSGGYVYMFGNSDYRAEALYLARTPESSFATGQGTEYFAGIVDGQPTWSPREADVVAVVEDNPLNGPAWPNDSSTIGNVSVVYSSELGLWLMTYDGGAVSSSTLGVHLTYAANPWGPWATPQLIYNARREPGFRTFIHDPTATTSDGLARPIAAEVEGRDPETTSGAIYAPYMIERFMRVSGDRLRIQFILSTWNPYVVVRMRSDLTISRN